MLQPTGKDTVKQITPKTQIQFTEFLKELNQCLAKSLVSKFPLFASVLSSLSSLCVPEFFGSSW